MRTTVLLGMMLILCTAVTAAFTVNNEEINLASIDQDHIDEGVQTYNEQYSDQMPGMVEAITSDERVTVNISVENDTAVYGVAMDGMRIDRVERGGLAEPTLIVHTSADTVEDIATADSPQDRAITALREGDIRYQSIGLVRSIKFSAVTTLLKLFG